MHRTALEDVRTASTAQRTIRIGVLLAVVFAPLLSCQWTVGRGCSLESLIGDRLPGEGGR